MKHSINKHTNEYLDQLGSTETKVDNEDYIFKPDSLDMDEDLSLRGLLQYELTHSDVALSY